MKRKNLLKMGEDALKKVKIPFKLRKEQKNLESWILDYEEKVATYEAEIADLKSKDDMSVDKILNKVDEMALAQRRLEQGTALMKELFD